MQKERIKSSKSPNHTSLHSSGFKTDSTSRRLRTASHLNSANSRNNFKLTEYRKELDKNVRKSMTVLQSNVNNFRYPGFSVFQSSNTFQNSSYCWSFLKGNRFSFFGKKSSTDFRYTLPSTLSTKHTKIGISKRNQTTDFTSAFIPAPPYYTITSVFDSNIKHKKGFTQKPRLKSAKDSRSYVPGVGTYQLSKSFVTQDIPILIKSRREFFYHDDLRKKRFTVSMQKYYPKYSLTENNRFGKIRFGTGKRTPNENRSIMDNPGPGAYDVPGCFDRGYRGKLVLN
jgi:hypothetical protein